MDFWATFKDVLASVKGYIPGALILLVGLPIIWWGTRRPKEKLEKKEKKTQKN